MKKSWNSPGKSWNSVVPFPYEPCLNTMFCLLSVSCLAVELFVPIHTTVMLTVCYINRQPGRGYHYSETIANSFDTKAPFGRFV